MLFNNDDEEYPDYDEGDAFNGFSNKRHDYTPISVIDDIASQILIEIFQALVGAIAWKGDVKSTTHSSGSASYVLPIIIRDIDSSIILNIWGEQEIIESLASTYSIFDLISVTCVRAKPKRQGSEHWVPITSSHYELIGSVNPQKNILCHFDDSSPDADTVKRRLLEAIKIPINVEAGHFRLADIISDRTSFENRYVNMLVCVSSIEDAQSFVSKAGHSIVKRHIHVFDETVSDFSICIWGNSTTLPEDLGWIPFETRLYFTDAKISSFRDVLQASMERRTALCMNPTLIEARNLYVYASLNGGRIRQEQGKVQRTHPGNPIGSYSALDLDRIHESVCIAELLSHSKEKDPWVGRITGAIEAMRGWKKRSDCRGNDDGTTIELLSLIEPNNGGDGVPQFCDNARVNVIDYSGSTEVIIPGSDIERLIGINAHNLENMVAEQRISLANQILFERISIITEISSITSTNTKFTGQHNAVALRVLHADFAAISKTK